MLFVNRNIIFQMTNLRHYKQYYFSIYLGGYTGILWNGFSYGEIC